MTPYEASNEYEKTGDALKKSGKAAEHAFSEMLFEPLDAGSIRDPLDRTIDAHWHYIEKLLIAHGESGEIIKKIKFHYKTAFRHGWKHGVESVKI